MGYIYEYIRRDLGKKIKKGIFYDLGSGTGKAIIAMALFHPFLKLIGIEFLDSLYRLSMYSKKAYDSSIKEKYIKFKGLFTLNNLNRIEFYNADFLKQKWYDASIIFINSTCFSDNLMIALANKANMECEEGVVIITITKRLKCLDNTWETKESFKRIMSWGLATIFIHIKK